MKTTQKLVLLGLLFFTANHVSAQNYDPRLEPFYTNEQIQELLENDKETYQFLIKALDKAIFIADIPQEKTPVEYAGILAIDPNATHTFLSLGLEITDRYQYFKIEGTEKMLVVLPLIFLESKK